MEWDLHIKMTKLGCVFTLYFSMRNKVLHHLTAYDLVASRVLFGSDDKIEFNYPVTSGALNAISFLLGHSYHP